jgi:hypothetical protein
MERKKVMRKQRRSEERGKVEKGYLCAGGV